MKGFNQDSVWLELKLTFLQLLRQITPYPQLFPNNPEIKELVEEIFSDYHQLKLQHEKKGN